MAVVRTFPVHLVESTTNSDGVWTILPLTDDINKWDAHSSTINSDEIDQKDSFRIRCAKKINSSNKNRGTTLPRILCNLVAFIPISSTLHNDIVKQRFSLIHPKMARSLLISQNLNHIRAIPSTTTMAMAVYIVDTCSCADTAHTHTPNGKPKTFIRSPFWHMLIVQCSRAAGSTQYMVYCMRLVRGARASVCVCACNKISIKSSLECDYAVAMVFGRITPLTDWLI